MTTKKKSAKSPARKKASTAPPAEMKDMMRQLEQMLAEAGNSSIVVKSDLNALVASLGGPSPHDRLSDAEADAKGEAQQIAFDAMEAESEAQARKLAKRALKLDPDCVDALLVLTDVDAKTPRQTIEGLQKAVAAGERSLGEKFIRENKGHFWMIMDTRPYMRALETLGGALSSQGIYLDAIGIYEKMLKLNPNDNQGVRDPLLGLYLAVGDLTGAGKLLKKYKNDSLANFAWGRVLERFLAGDDAGAREALERARAANRFVEQYITAQRPLPEELPEMYSPGSEEEAALCMIHAGLGWAHQQEALFWLHEQRVVEGIREVPSKPELMRKPVKGKRVQ